MLNKSKSSSHILSQLSKSHKLILALIIFIALFLLVGAGKILIIMFPLSCFALGLFFYANDPPMYVGFTWWLWFIAPLVRRLIDYQCGYITFGPWSLAALLVTSISFYTFIRNFPILISKSDYLPFLMCFVTLLYGLVIGVIQNPIDLAVINFLGWLCPFSFGVHLFISWRNYIPYKQVILKTFFWGAFVMGIYGTLQFIIAPEWDRFWLLNITASSFGKPEPFGIRVPSTMGSPHGFAASMMAGLILLLYNQRNFFYLPATMLGYLTLLLSKARTAWLSWMVALLIFVATLRSSFQIKIIISILLVLVLVSPLTTIEPFSEVIFSRLTSFSNLDRDISLNARLRGYDLLLEQAVSEITGKGFGFIISGAGIGANDSAILPTLLILGWFGTLFFCFGIILLVLKLFSNKVKSDPFINAANSIALGIASQVALNNFLLSTVGMVFWTFLGITLAGQKYYTNLKILSKSRSL